MMNNFQKSLTSNKNCIWDIVKIFHPDIEEEKKEKIKAYIKYDWVCIRGCGVDIGIQFECHLMSGFKPLHLFEKELKNNEFRAWRFVEDSKYKLENKEELRYLKVFYKKCLNDILKKHNIEKPTARQMSDFYHSE